LLSFKDVLAKPEQALLVLSGKSNLLGDANKIGPALLFERLWEELGRGKVLKQLVADRLFGFYVERAVFLTALHRLMTCGSDRFCNKWRRDYLIRGAEGLSRHHLCRAMAFLGEETDDQRDATPFSPRCVKDLMEEWMFHGQRHLKELCRRMEASDQRFEWAEIKQDLKSVQEISLEEDGKRLASRTQCQGTCGKVFQAVGVAVPPTIRHLDG
jgi:hypothetical protein